MEYSSLGENIGQTRFHTKTYRLIQFNYISIILTDSSFRTRIPSRRERKENYHTPHDRLLIFTDGSKLKEESQRIGASFTYLNNFILNDMEAALRALGSNSTGDGNTELTYEQAPCRLPWYT